MSNALMVVVVLVQVHLARLFDDLPELVEQLSVFDLVEHMPR